MALVLQPEQGEEQAAQAVPVKYSVAVHWMQVLLATTWL
jgi:hypothetical protein